MLDDTRIKAIGLYLEGFGDIRALEKFARESRRKNIPIVILKTGKTEESRSAAISHTRLSSKGLGFMKLKLWPNFWNV